MYQRSTYQSQRVVQQSVVSREVTREVPERARYGVKDNQRGTNQQDLDVVVFLMAVEIDKLQRENTAMKNEILAHETNNMDRVSYEVQIRDLMEKIQQLQASNDSYHTDNGKLVSIITDLENQIVTKENIFKQQISELQISISTQSKLFGGKSQDQFQREFDELKKKAKQFDDLQKQFNIQPDQIAKELTELRKKSQQLDDLLRALNGRTISSLEQEISSLKVQQSKYEEIYTLFGSGDIKRQIEELKNKSKELDKVNKSLNGSNPENLQRTIDELTRQIQQKNQSHSEFNDHINNLQNDNRELETIIDGLDKKNRELEERVVQLASEIQRFQYMLKSKDTEIEKLKQQLAQLTQLTAEIESYKLQISKISNELYNTQTENKQMRSDYYNLSTEHGNLKKDNQSLQQDIRQSQRDLDKLQNLQDQVNQLQSSNKALQSQAQEYKTQLTQNNSGIKEVKVDLEKSQKRVLELENKLKEMDRYVDTLENDLNKFESENAQLNLQLQGLLRLQAQYDDLKREAMMNRAELNSVSKLQDELNRYKADLSKANQLIQNQQNEIAQKERDLTHFEQSLQDLESHNAQLEKQNQQLNSALYVEQQKSDNGQDELNRLRSIVDEYKEKILQMESRFKNFSSSEERLKQSDHRNAVLMTEIERLNSLVKQVTSEAEEWKQKYGRIELSLLEYRQIQMTNRDAASKNQALLQEIERLKLLLEEKHESLMEISQQYASTRSQLQSASQKADTTDNALLQYLLVVAENERLSNDLGPKNEKLKQLQSRLSEVEIQYRELTVKTQMYSTDEFERLKRKIIEYENQIAMLSMELQRLKPSTQIKSSSYQASVYQESTFTYGQQIYSNGQQRITSQNYEDNSPSARKINDLLCLIVMMSAELDSLRTYK